MKPLYDRGSNTSLYLVLGGAFILAALWAITVAVMVVDKVIGG